MDFPQARSTCLVWRRPSTVEGLPTPSPSTAKRPWRRVASEFCSIRKVAVQWDIMTLARQPGRYARSLDEPKNTTTPPLTRSRSDFIRFGRTTRTIGAVLLLGLVGQPLFSTDADQSALEPDLWPNTCLQRAYVPAPILQIVYSVPGSDSSGSSASVILLRKSQANSTCVREANLKSNLSLASYRRPISDYCSEELVTCIHRIFFCYMSIGQY